MENEIDQLSFEDLLSVHRNAIQYYNSWTGSQIENPMEQDKEDSTLELIRRISIDLNVTRRENKKLKEEIKELIEQKRKV